ncbi:hypothetical protein PoB_004844700 [Plakobranchus ocellatus]|uniref:Uncharacterized protein n=1 Tax=Plakobranchus ocellatus TaxID=259542 RepID=A0AAV4BRI4_9GAST|nr:hypothetical protein PoB_004844700 [Plakobranchus ocellatus]
MEATGFTSYGPMVRHLGYGDLWGQASVRVASFELRMESLQLWRNVSSRLHSVTISCLTIALPPLRHWDTLILPGSGTATTDFKCRFRVYSNFNCSRCDSDRPFLAPGQQEVQGFLVSGAHTIVDQDVDARIQGLQDGGEAPEHVGQTLKL